MEIKIYNLNISKYKNCIDIRKIKFSNIKQETVKNYILESKNKNLGKKKRKHDTTNYVKIKRQIISKIVTKKI